eukprot:CAMPEP_0173397596 /NCGR_PEP_ID=MMETSP1356-20130122/38880_1 /TAXON_ID=77927 ORGANISM="Hemiselmis virescens, Strain PCC157" /NCGR_SAMPLE_ID=MMETSP1356 /ASSEMBLY_ACC=CAM_ASM_000847 /LENGTH=97 /DNA_ID=CAMNT_0014356881 /DNA_START=171 /DNA_END=464 /DNA_ORIENTATION=+
MRRAFRTTLSEAAAAPPDAPRYVFHTLHSTLAAAPQQAAHDTQAKQHHHYVNRHDPRLRLQGLGNVVCQSSVDVVKEGRHCRIAQVALDLFQCSLVL